jgi:hypothetical protein
VKGEIAKTLLSEYGGDLERLNVHSHQGCNLRCSGCNHHSEIVDIQESIDCDQVVRDLDHLLSRINVRHINVLGGEPLLNPQGTRKILEYLIGRGQKTKMTTNGFYIHKHENWIIPLIKKGLILKISFHLHPQKDKNGPKLAEKVQNFLVKARKDGILIHNGIQQYVGQDKGWIEFSPEFERKSNWMKLFKEEEGDQIYPYESDKDEAFKLCVSACPNMYKGRLYKCPHMAYLEDSVAIKGQLDDPQWQKYLQYRGYDIYDDSQIQEFLRTAYVAEDVCSSCPDTPTYITMNQDPSITKHRIPIKEVL